MAQWFYYALLSPALQTLTVCIDGFNVKYKVEDFRCMSLFSSFMSLIAGLFFFVLTGFPLLPLRDALIIMLAGAFYAWAVALYFWLFNEEEFEFDRIVFYLQSIAVFTFIFSGAKLTLPLFIGFVLILLSIVGIAKFNGTGIRVVSRKSILLIIFSNALFALSGVTYKYVSSQVGFFESIAYESLGWFIGGFALLLLRPVRASFITTLKAIPLSAYGFVFGGELVFVIARIIGFKAISLGPVTNVTIIGATVVFFGLIYSVLLNRLFPKYFKERLSLKEFIIKGALAVVSIAGVFITTL